MIDAIEQQQTHTDQNAKRGPRSVGRDTCIRAAQTPDVRARIKASPRVSAEVLTVSDDWEIETLCRIGSPTAWRIALLAADLTAAGRGRELTEVYVGWAARVDGEGRELLAIALDLARSVLAGRLPAEPVIDAFLGPDNALRSEHHTHRAAQTIMCALEKPDPRKRHVGFSRAVELLDALACSSLAPLYREPVLRELELDLEAFLHHHDLEVRDAT